MCSTAEFAGIRGSIICGGCAGPPRYLLSENMRRHDYNAALIGPLGADVSIESFLAQLDPVPQCMPCGGEIIYDDRKFLSEDRQTRLVARCDQPINDMILMDSTFDELQESIRDQYQQKVDQYIEARKENEKYWYNSQVVRAGQFQCVETKRPVQVYPMNETRRFGEYVMARPDTITLQLTDLCNKPIKSDQILFGPHKQSVKDLPPQPLNSIWRSDQTLQGEVWMGCLLFGALAFDAILHIFTSKAML